jgi:hypothetical protein
MRLLVILLLLLLGHTLSSQASPSSLKTAWEQAKSLAKLDQIQGQVFVVTDKAEPETRATDGQPLLPRMEIRTEPNSNAVISFSEGSKVELSENGKYRLDSLSPTKISIFVSIGKVHSIVSKVPGRDFEVRTPTSVSNVRGTQYTVTVDASGETNYTIIEGSVTVTDSTGNKVTLSAGQSMNIATPTNSNNVQKALKETIDKLTKQLQRKDLTLEEEKRFKDGLEALNRLSDKLDTTSDKALIEAINNRAGEILGNLGPDFTDGDLSDLIDLVDMEAIPLPGSTPSSPSSLIILAGGVIAATPTEAPPDEPVGPTDPTEDPTDSEPEPEPEPGPDPEPPSCVGISCGTTPDCPC